MTDDFNGNYEKSIFLEEIEKQEYEHTKNMFDFDKIYNFCKEHRVEIIFEKDMQYYCYIDYKDGDGCYAVGLYALNSLVEGILSYLRDKNE